MRRRNWLIWSAAAGVSLARPSAGHAQGPGLWPLLSRWTDDHGRPVGARSWDAPGYVVTLAYGACRRICSSSLRFTEQVLAQSAQSGQPLQAIVLGLDAQEDRPQDWRALREVRRWDEARWHLLSADESQVRQVAAFLGVRIWRYDSHWMHDYQVMRVDGQGRVARKVTRFDERPEDLLAGR